MIGPKRFSFSEAFRRASGVPAGPDSFYTTAVRLIIGFKYNVAILLVPVYCRLPHYPDINFQYIWEQHMGFHTA
jgi:hypothetical protein